MRAVHQGRGQAQAASCEQCIKKRQISTSREVAEAEALVLSPLRTTPSTRQRFRFKLMNPDKAPQRPLVHRLLALDMVRQSVLWSRTPRKLSLLFY